MDVQPFDHQRPVFEDGAFLDRAAETKKLRDLIVKRENVLVYGYRRRGKTSLIRRVQASLPKSVASIYLDGFLCVDVVEAGTRLLNAIAETGLGKGPRFVKWAQEVMQRLKITMNVGGKDAPMNFTVEVRDRAERTPFLNALEFLGHIADRSGKHVVVVLDEFQVIVDLIGEPGLKAMRAVVQLQKNVTYIISGSRVSTLRRIASDASKGFWTQLTHFPIKGLSILDIQGDVERIFKGKLSDEAKQYLLVTLGDCTQRLVQVLELAYPSGLGMPSLREAVGVAVEKNTPSYQGELTHITSNLEKQLLFALAREHTKEPRSGAWLRRHDITASPAGVHQALARLQDDVLDAEHHFVDALFAIYLSQ